ncbi:MAG: retropepsin-like aspartic protease [Ginsengibacter sp.]
MKAKINGIEGNFIFDTEAGITVLTKKFSTKLHNIRKQDGVPFRTTGERQDVDLYTVNDFRIGNLVEKNQLSRLLI